jgi:hypothetical protein
LLLRRHLDGARVGSLARVAGERTLVLEAGRAVLALRIAGPAPALTLAVDGVPTASIGGAPAWPLPPPRPEREWDRIEPGELAAAVARADPSRGTVRAVLAVCPTLGPVLARELDGRAGSLAALRARLATPRPTVVLPAPLDRCHDADLVPEAAVALAPVAPLVTPRFVLSPATWREAAALFLEARARGRRFDRRRRHALERTGTEIRRLARLEVRLLGDLESLPDAPRLRRQAESLLATRLTVPPGATEAEVPDAYQSGSRLRVALDPRLTAPGNANRLFDKARRVERARAQMTSRLAETRAALAAAQAEEARARAALDATELDPPPAESAARDPRDGSGPRHYLTSRGLSVLVGRGAKQNHHLTFSVARAEDLWLHARGVPGAHVVLRDPEGRAGAEDLREAAELAAFFSDARREAKVDVHVTRRKHLRPTRGAPGRVTIGHSETLRVTPRDPEGRLRRR